MSETQNERLKRAWLYIPFAVAAALLLAYYGLWRAGAARIETAISTWAAAQNESGYSVSYDDTYTEGFPFFLRVHVERPSIEAPGAWGWSGEKLTIDALPYQLDRLVFTPEGAQEIFAQRIGAWRIEAETLRAGLRRDKARGWVFSATITSLAAEARDGRKAALGELIFDLGPADRTSGALLLSLQAAGGTAPGAEGAEIALQSLRTVLIASEARALGGGAEAWRLAGGALTVNGLRARLDEADIALQGELALDADHYPAGRLQTEITNPAPFALTLGKAGALTGREARAAAAGLSLLSLANNGTIGAPIDFKNGRAEIAGIKIAKTPKVD